MVRKISIEEWRKGRKDQQQPKSKEPSRRGIPRNAGEMPKTARQRVGRKIRYGVFVGLLFGLGFAFYFDFSYSTSMIVGALLGALFMVLRYVVFPRRS